MSKEFQTVAVLGLYADPRVADPMTLLAEYLTKSGAEVITPASATASLPAQAVDDADIAAEADLIIAVGGDGTMLHAASSPTYPRQRCWRISNRSWTAITRGKVGCS
jgi:NAD kinase